MKKGLIGIAVMVLVIVVLARVAPISQFLSSIFDPKPTIRDSATLLTEIQHYAVLETVRYNYEKVVPAEFAPGVGGEKLLYIGVGYVSAGVNVAQLDEGAIKIEGQSVTFTLPPARLTACVLDAQKSYVYQHDTGILNFITDAFSDEPDLLELAEREAIIAFRDSALEAGILVKAQADAEMYLRSILMTAGATSVTFRTLTQQPEHDPSCFPQNE